MSYQNWQGSEGKREGKGSPKGKIGKNGVNKRNNKKKKEENLFEKVRRKIVI